MPLRQCTEKSHFANSDVAAAQHPLLKKRDTVDRDGVQVVGIVPMDRRARSNFGDGGARGAPFASLEHSLLPAPDAPRIPVGCSPTFPNSIHRLPVPLALFQRRLSQRRSTIDRRSIEPSQERGVVVLELLLVLPIYVLLVLGIIQLSLMYQVDKQVAYASRFGAKIASETTRELAAPIRLSNLALSGELRRQVDCYLENAGLTGSCGVILEHNACVPNPIQEDVDPGCDCSPPVEPLPGGEPGDAAYVRVTVCVPLAGNVLDILPAFDGFSVADMLVRHATIFRIEEDNQPPDPVLRMPAQPIAGGTVSPPLPVTSPPTPSVTITLDATAPNGLTLTFDGANTTDPEEPLADLTLTWAADTDGNGSLETMGAGVTFTTAFDTPGPGDTLVHRVRLTATDGCLAQGQTQLIVRIERETP